MHPYLPPLQQKKARLTNTISQISALEAETKRLETETKRLEDIKDNHAFRCLQDVRNAYCGIVSTYGLWIQQFAADDDPDMVDQKQPDAPKSKKRPKMIDQKQLDITEPKNSNEITKELIDYFKNNGQCQSIITYLSDPIREQDVNDASATTSSLTWQEIQDALQQITDLEPKYASYEAANSQYQANVLKLSTHQTQLETARLQQQNAITELAIINSQLYAPTRIQQLKNWLSNTWYWLGRNKRFANSLCTLAIVLAILFPASLLVTLPMLVMTLTFIPAFPTLRNFVEKYGGVFAFIVLDFTASIFLPLIPTIAAGLNAILPTALLEVTAATDSSITLGSTLLLLSPLLILVAVPIALWGIWTILNTILCNKTAAATAVVTPIVAHGIEMTKSNAQPPVAEPAFSQMPNIETPVTTPAPALRTLASSTAMSSSSVWDKAPTTTTSNLTHRMVSPSYQHQHSINRVVPISPPPPLTPSYSVVSSPH